MKPILNHPIQVLTLACCALLSGSLTRADVSQPQGLPADPASAVAQEVYRMTAGDVIEVRLFYNPELNEQVQIRPDGFISLQLIGDIEVADLTIPEAVTLLRDKFAKEVKSPSLTIQVKSYAGRKVYVLGEVVRPAVINLPGPMTVFSAIGEAGGIKNTGNRSIAVLLRKGPTGAPEGRKLVLFKHGALTADASILLGPYDVVMVPESKISRLDRWVDQTIRQVIPTTTTAGFNYIISRQTGGGTSVPIF